MQCLEATLLRSELLAEARDTRLRALMASSSGRCRRISSFRLLLGSPRGHMGLRDLLIIGSRASSLVHLLEQLSSPQGGSLGVRWLLEIIRRLGSLGVSGLGGCLLLGEHSTRHPGDGDLSRLSRRLASLQDRLVVIVAIVDDGLLLVVRGAVFSLEEILGIAGAVIEDTTGSHLVSKPRQIFTRIRVLERIQRALPDDFRRARKIADARGC